MDEAGEIRAQVAEVDRAQRRRLLMLTPAVFIFVAIGVWMVRSGEPFGWASILFFGSAVPAFPLMLLRTYRRSRYRGGPLIARRVIGETMFGVLVGLVAGAGGLVMGWLLRDDIRVGLIGLGGGAFFVLIAVLGLAQCLDRRPVIVVDEHGYFDRRFMRAAIPWSAIQDVESVGYRGQTMFNLQATAPRRNRTFLTILSHGMGFSGYSITANGLDCTLADLLVAIRNYSSQSEAA